MDKALDSLVGGVGGGEEQMIVEDLLVLHSPPPPPPLPFFPMTKSSIGLPVIHTGDLKGECNHFSKGPYIHSFILLHGTFIILSKAGHLF